jgi:hypothetical protein
VDKERSYALGSHLSHFICSLIKMACPVIFKKRVFPTHLQQAMLFSIFNEDGDVDLAQIEPVFPLSATSRCATWAHHLLPGCVGNGIGGYTTRLFEEANSMIVNSMTTDTLWSGRSDESSNCSRASKARPSRFLVLSQFHSSHSLHH